MPPIHIHPKNPKIFEFRGKPLILLTASEHYGAVMNRPFRFERYLEDAAEKKMTVTRLFTLFRELQVPGNPYSTCKPDSPDYVAPFKRVGPDWTPLDGFLPKYDLDQWNPEFFERLHRFLSLASEYGIIVEVVLFSNTYNNDVWNLNPLNPENNINNIRPISWHEYTTMRNPRLFEYQLKYLVKLLHEVNPYDNIFFELCNEAGGNAGQAGSPDAAEVNEWLRAIAATIRETESKLPNRHLIAGQEAFIYVPWEQPTTMSFKDFPVDIVNMHAAHYFSKTTYEGKSYDFGPFLRRQLRLSDLKNYLADTYNEPKPLNSDEDNPASSDRTESGWIIQRKRAWATLFGAGHFDCIDFSIVNYMETGTPEAQRAIRVWIKYLSEYIHSIDLVRARPDDIMVKEHPAQTMPFVFAVENEDYNIYLVDARELDQEGYGSGIGGSIECDLPEGAWQVACYNPATGVYSPWIALKGSKATVMSLPRFTHDIVVRIRREAGLRKEQSV